MLRSVKTTIHVDQMNQNIEKLTSSKQALESSVDKWSTWLELWTALVVFGLVIEYGPEIIRFIRERDRKLLHTLVGGLFITIGVAGELFVGMKASKDETDLRTVNDSIAAIYNKEASEARRDAENVKKTSEALKLAVAQSQERAASAQSRAAEAQLALARLVLPRSLSQKNRNRLSAELKRRPPQRFIPSFAADLESVEFSTIIVQTTNRRRMAGCEAV